jgi:rhamnogalacturonan endolyase
MAPQNAQASAVGGHNRHRNVLGTRRAGTFGAACRDPGAVTLSEDGQSYLIFNGILAARIEKSSGNLVSLHYQGLELLGGNHANSSGGYWNLIGRCSPGTNATASVHINPATNGGARAEISCRLFNNPNAPDRPLDADYRYSLGRGEHWLYVYSVLEHKPGYPALSVQEARYCLKLNPNVFDYLNIDGQRRRVMPSGYDWDHSTPLNLSEARRMTTGIHKGEVEHKYDYSAVLVDTPAYGWLSTQQRLGLWMINPSMEYLGGEATKVELTGHLDSNKGGLAVLLNMWAGSHYGGCMVSADVDKQWTKVVGPFLLYCNAASLQGGERMTERAREVLWQDALSRATNESAAWPYVWMSDSNYPPASRRA